MIGLQGIIVAVSILWLFGATMLGFTQDIAYTIYCGGCSDGIGQITHSVSDIVTAGQNSVSNGIDGLNELKAQSCLAASGCPQFTKLQVISMSDSYKSLIVKGSLLTLIYIAIFFLLFTKGIGSLTNFEPPFILSLIVSASLVALLYAFFTGFKQMPYAGWISLLQNTWIWSSVAVQDVSFGPPGNLTANASR